MTYRIAVITTTINVPHFLRLLSAFANQNESHVVHFFVAGDKKTPEEAEDFCLTIDGCHYYSANVQQTLGYKCSDHIGWNTDSRRNIALLEALKWKPDLILSIDDDMIAQHDPFTSWVQLFSQPFHGLQLGAEHRWFDHGKLTFPAATARGVPPEANAGTIPKMAVNKRIGMAQGIILGVADAAATAAIEGVTSIHTATGVLASGFIVHPKARAVFNSQWTAFRPELAPAFAQHYPSQQRNTDIIASLLMRRVARDRNLHTWYGPPTAFHNRAPRPLLNDLKAEMFGMTHIDSFADYLERVPLKGTSITRDCQYLIEGNSEVYLPSSDDFWSAWFEDVAGVL